MKNKKPRQGPKGLAGWYASYADMVTVLMVFFILMFSMSVIDQDLFEQFIESFNPSRQDVSIAMGGDVGDIPLMEPASGDGLMPHIEPPPPAPVGDGGEGADGYEFPLEAEDEGDVISDMMSAFRTYMAQLDPSAEVGYWQYVYAEETEHFLRITLPATEGMLFSSGQATLLPPAIEALNIIAPFLEESVAMGHAIVVEGHTDNVAMQTAMFPSNRHLSAARASTVVEHLVAYWDISPLAIMSTGAGEYRPIETNETPEGRAANRRVEIMVFDVSGSPDGTMTGGWVIPGIIQ